MFTMLIILVKSISILTFAIKKSWVWWDWYYFFQVFGHKPNDGQIKQNQKLRDHQSTTFREIHPIAVDTVNSKPQMSASFIHFALWMSVHNFVPIHQVHVITLCLYKTSWKFIEQLLNYFSLNQSGGLSLPSLHPWHWQIISILYIQFHIFILCGIISIAACTGC